MRRHRARATGRGAPPRPIEIGAAPELGEPVRERDDGSPSARASASRSAAAPDRFESPRRDRRRPTARDAREQDDDERHRREPDREEGRPPELAGPGPEERQRHEEGSDHDEAERERIDDKPRRAAQRPTRLPAAVSENADAAQAERGHGQELELAHDLGRVGPRRDLEEVVSGPNPPSDIRTISSTIATAYAVATSARSNVPCSWPSGNAR